MFARFLVQLNAKRFCGQGRTLLRDSISSATSLVNSAAFDAASFSHDCSQTGASRSGVLVRKQVHTQLGLLATWISLAHFFLVRSNSFAMTLFCFARSLSKSFRSMGPQRSIVALGQDRRTAQKKKTKERESRKENKRGQGHTLCDRNWRSSQ